MRWLRKLGLGRPPQAKRPRLADRVRGRVHGLTEERCELVTAFAGLLVRVAYADDDVSEAERAVVRDVIAARGLSPEESTAVTDLVVEQASGLAGIDYAALTRVFNELGTQADKERLIECLYAIATADDTVSVVEDEEIRKVSQALLLGHGTFISIRSRYKEQLEVIQVLRQQRER